MNNEKKVTTIFLSPRNVVIEGGSNEDSPNVKNLTLKICISQGSPKKNPLVYIFTYNYLLIYFNKFIL